jgi:glutamate synthase domain-containing protein 3
MRYHPEFLVVEGFGAVECEAQEALRRLVEMHVEESGSELARAMLADWPGRAGAFVRLTPKPQA